MKKTYDSHKNKRIIVASIAFAMVVTFAILRETVVKEKFADITAIDSYIQDGGILLSWDMGDASVAEEVVIDISPSTRFTCNPADGSFLFTEGEHGKLYDISIHAVFPHGEGQEYSLSSLFIDYDELPGIPLLYIDTDSGFDPTYEEADNENGKFMGRSITKNYYEDGILKLYRNGQINTEEESDYKTRIKIRGNTSSVLYDKKSYKLNFDEPVALLENKEDVKRNNWVLISNASNIRTFVGYTVADICDLEWKLDMQYVNVVLNGDWLGCYILTENVDEQSADGLVSESGYIFENDMYWWNTDGMYFQTFHQDPLIAYTFKYPNLYDRRDIRIQFLEDYMQSFENLLFEGNDTYADYIDLDSFTRWIMARDILSNSDGGGSNMFFYKESYDESNPTATRVKMGPLWDFDLIFEYQDYWTDSRDYHVYYFDELWKQDDFYETYRHNWNEIKDDVLDKINVAVEELRKSQGEEINKSWILDSSRWNEEYTSIETRQKNAYEWLAEKIDWMKENVEIH